jgi:hypothetical protein
MDADHLLIMALVCAAAYFAGYRNIALALLLIVGLIFLFGGKKEKSYYSVPGGGVRVHGAQSLEPIVIETTRGAPFRIPKQIDMRIQPKWSAMDLMEKASGRGAGSLAKLAHGAAFGRKTK